jgi:hypothetical protein
VGCAPDGPAKYSRVLGCFFETFLRSTCLEWLCQTLAAMQDIWMSLHSIRSRSTSLLQLHRRQFQPPYHAACFNARGLLYECVLDALLFSSSYRPVEKPVSHHVVTRPTFSSLFWIIIPAILSATMLGYYSMSASLMPSEFFHRRCRCGIWSRH